MRTTNAVASSVVSLTVDNLPEMTDQKAVFIKFFAPWYDSHDYYMALLL